MVTPPVAFAEDNFSIQSLGVCLPMEGEEVLVDDPVPSQVEAHGGHGGSHVPRGKLHEVLVDFFNMSNLVSLQGFFIQDSSVPKDSIAEMKLGHILDSR